MTYSNPERSALESKRHAPSAFLFALAIALAACAAPVYTVEEGVPTALARFTTDYRPGSTTFYDVHDLSQCPLGFAKVSVNMTPELLFHDGVVSEVSMIGTSKKPEKSIRERKIRADKRMLFYASAEKPSGPYVAGYSCSLAFAFRPVPDAQYEIAFKNRDMRCTVDVHRLSLDASGAVIRTTEPTTERLRAASIYGLCPPDRRTPPRQPGPVE